MLIRATLGRPGTPARQPPARQPPARQPPARQPPPGRRPCPRRRPAGRGGGPGETVLVADLHFSALLSQALVAFTIEADNEAEHQLPHRTTWGPAAHSGHGPWLVSLTMWADFLRFVPAAGVALRDVADLVPLTNLAGLERWGYVRSGPIPRTPASPAPP